MVNPNRIVVALLLLLMHSLAWAVKLDVTLDSNEISTGDTVNLTVTVDEQAFGRAPDFSPLKKDFSILSNRQSSQYSMVNGKITSSTSWILTLQPRNEGFLAVPPLQYGGEASKPLKLHVTQRSQAEPVNSTDVVFMDAQVDRKEVYVQQQVIYTVRLYRRIDLHDSEYFPPKVDEAVMEPLGNKREYMSTQDGRSYIISEQRYVIFPQKSGELDIPAAEITGTIFLSGNNSFLMDPFNGKQIRRKSPALRLTVKPQPASYPVDKPWLPAHSLKLQESWKPANPEFKVGEPVTRSIMIEAEGLAPSVLPPIKPPTFPNLKLYPEQAETASNIGARGQISTRTENLAMIATAPGTLELPPVEVTWWDLDEEKVKVAQLPAHTLQIEGAAPQQQTDGAMTTPTAAAEPDDAPASISGEVNHTWQWIALVALVLWLLTLGGAAWLWRQRQAAANAQDADAPDATERFSSAQANAARQKFDAACASNDAAAARTALIDWYRQQFQNPQLHNLHDIGRLTPTPALEMALMKLDAVLYRSGKTNEWKGSELQQAVTDALAQQQKEGPVSHLQPLYPV
ncbi:MAG TPA: BatD family protein [Dongiaceae bacterium]|nr:BatD family protein [Dongiaceae bacterium]